MVPSDQVYEFMIDKSRFSSTNELLNQNFFNALPKSIQSEFQKQSTSAKLTANQNFLVKINLNNQPTYFAFAPIENTSWNVVIVKPVKDVIKNATQLSNDMEGVINHFYLQLIIMGFGFLLVIIVGGGISLQWLVAPIQELAKGAQEVIRGNLGYRVSLPSRNETKNKDELSELMDVFNQMMDTLHQNQLTINNQKSNLEHALKKKEQEFDIVNQISLLTNQTTDLSKNLAKALEISIKATGMNDGLVLLCEENKQFSLAAFYSDSHQRSEINNLFYNCLDHGLIKKALQDRNILSNELNSNITFSYENSSCSVASWIIVPLIQKSREIGAFVLFSENKSNLLSEWLVFLQAIATHISVLIENNQLQDRMRELYIVEERRKIARELHDSVTQSLFSMSLMIEGMKSSDSIKKDEINSFLEILNSHTENIQKEIRVLIQELRPINLDGENLDSAILAHVSSLSRSTNTIVNIDFKGDFGKIPIAIQQNINRIVQESFSNIARHSQATKVDVLLKAEPHTVCLTIDDNGIGFDTHFVARNVTSNLGLMSMRERAELLNGVLLIRSKPGCGSHIEVHIPVDLLPQD
jgi:signal transduction histidine kinase/HAMP domain-containing protein